MAKLAISSNQELISSLVESIESPDSTIKVSSFNLPRKIANVCHTFVRSAFNCAFLWQNGIGLGVFVNKSLYENVYSVKNKICCYAITENVSNSFLNPIFTDENHIFIEQPSHVRKFISISKPQMTILMQYLKYFARFLSSNNYSLYSFRFIMQPSVSNKLLKQLIDSSSKNIPGIDKFIKLFNTLSTFNINPKLSDTVENHRIEKWKEALSHIETLKEMFRVASTHHKAVMLFVLSCFLKSGVFHVLPVDNKFMILHAIYSFGIGAFKSCDGHSVAKGLLDEFSADISSADVNMLLNIRGNVTQNVKDRIRHMCCSDDVDENVKTVQVHLTNPITSTFGKIISIQNSSSSDKSKYVLHPLA